MGSSSVEIDDGRSEAYRRASQAFVNPVAAGFFQHLGLPLRAGREFDHNDGPQNERVAIVTETFRSRILGRPVTARKTRQENCKKSGARRAVADYCRSRSRSAG